MPITNALASVAVRDLPAAARWYEQLLGPGRRPMPEVVEWELPSGGGLQVYRAPERAGQGSCTLIVGDVDAIARELRTAGLVTDAQRVHDDRVDTLMIKDPDGNSIAFAAPKDETLAR